MIDITWDESQKDIIYKLLKKYKNDINKKDFTRIYATVNGIDAISPLKDSIRCTPILSSLLLNSGINPLSYLNSVPEFYLSKANIDYIVIPNNIIKIGRSAFERCELLQFVNLSKSLTTIEPFAFYHCSNIVAISFPKSIKEIGQSAFLACNKLQHIFYNGTIREWNNMHNHNNFKGIYINCSDGKIMV